MDMVENDSSGVVNQLISEMLDYLDQSNRCGDNKNADGMTFSGSNKHNDGDSANTQPMLEKICLLNNENLKPDTDATTPSIFYNGILSNERATSVSDNGQQGVDELNIFSHTQQDAPASQALRTEVEKTDDACEMEYDEKPALKSCLLDYDNNLKKPDILDNGMPSDEQHTSVIDNGQQGMDAQNKFSATHQDAPASQILRTLVEKTDDACQISYDEKPVKPLFSQLSQQPSINTVQLTDSSDGDFKADADVEAKGVVDEADFCEDEMSENITSENKSLATLQMNDIALYAQNAANVHEYVGSDGSCVVDTIGEEKVYNNSPTLVLEETSGHADDLCSDGNANFSTLQENVTQDTAGQIKPVTTSCSLSDETDMNVISTEEMWQSAQKDHPLSACTTWLPDEPNEGCSASTDFDYKLYAELAQSTTGLLWRLLDDKTQINKILLDRDSLEKYMQEVVAMLALYSQGYVVDDQLIVNMLGTLTNILTSSHSREKLIMGMGQDQFVSLISSLNGILVAKTTRKVSNQIICMALLTLNNLVIDKDGRQLMQSSDELKQNLLQVTSESDQAEISEGCKLAQELYSTLWSSVESSEEPPAKQRKLEMDVLPSQSITGLRTAET